MKEEKEYFEWTGEVITHQDIQKERLASIEKKLTIDPDLPKLTKILLKIQAMRKDVRTDEFNK